MKIIQISTAYVASEDYISIHGLGDDGFVYEWLPISCEWQKLSCLEK